MTQNDHYETKTSEIGAAAVECIESGNSDSEHKICSSIAEAGDVDACKLTPPICVTPSGDRCTVPEVDGKDYLVTNGDCLPVACKSACSLTVNDTDLSNCGTREGNTFGLGNDCSDEEKIVRVDSIVCGLSSAKNGKNVHEGHLSKRPKSTEEKVSAVENNGGIPEHKAEENSKLRARKRSKYLSPPFVELVKGEVSKESESPNDISIQESSNPSLVKCRKKKKQSEKSIAGSADQEAITLSSPELLLQLRMVARDYLNPYYDTAFDPTKLFVNSFRASVFSGLSRSEMISAAKKARTEKGDAQKMTKEKILAESDTKAPSGSCSVNANFTSSSPLKAEPQNGCNPESSNIKPQKKRKRKVEPLVNPVVNEAAQIPNLNSNNEVPTAKLDPMQVSDHSGPKSEPAKKKRIRKKEIPPLFTLSGFPYAYGSEACLQGARLISFAASTGLNSASIASSPPEPQSMKRVTTATGFDTNSKPTSETTLDAGSFSFAASTGLNNGNFASSPGLSAKGFTPTPPAPQAMKRVNPAIGFGTSNKSSSPGLCANGFTPRPAAPPHEPQSMNKVNTPANGFDTSNNSSSPGGPGLSANGFTPRPAAPPHEPQSMNKVNTPAIGFDTSNNSSSPGLCANGFTPRPAAPPHEPQSMSKVNTPIGYATNYNSSSPGTPRPQSVKRVNNTAFGFDISNKSSAPGLCAKGSVPRSVAPLHEPQSMKRVNTPFGFETSNKLSSPGLCAKGSMPRPVAPSPQPTASEMSLDQMKQNLEFMTSMLEKSGNMIPPAMRANLEKEIKNLLKKVNPMVSSSSS